MISSFCNTGLLLEKLKSQQNELCKESSLAKYSESEENKIRIIFVTFIFFQSLNNIRELVYTLIDSVTIL